MTRFSVFGQPSPNFSAQQISRLLQRDYGIRGQIDALVGDRDQNFRVRTTSGDYVLKIAHAAEDIGILELQNAALQHIAAVAPELGVQRLVPALDGESITFWDTGNGPHPVRVLGYLPGRLFSQVEQTPQLLASLGRFMGRLSQALLGFGHPAAHRLGFVWNLDDVAQRRDLLADVANEHRALVERVFARHQDRVVPALATLRCAVLHQDANDNNILVSEDGQCVTGLIDFGDMSHGRQINELAVTLAYALLDADDLYATTQALIAEYANIFPIEAAEAGILFDLVAARLACSVCISSHRAQTCPDNDYLQISQAPALRLLQRLDHADPDFLAALARHAAGLAPVATHDAVVDWLQSDACQPAPLFDFDLKRSGRIRISLATGAPGMQHADDPVAWQQWLQQQLDQADARFAIGLYGECRDTSVYGTGQFASAMSPERRSQHLGIDLFVPAGTALHAPLAGTVVSVVDNALASDYGPTVILQHAAGEHGPAFWTLYGHLSRKTLSMLRAGMEVEAGQHIGSIGEHEVNGGWAPHLHVQIITDRLGNSGNFPGAGQPSLWPMWQKICPHPNLLLRLAPESFQHDATPPDVLLARRAKVLAPSLSVSYEKKLKIVRGRGAWLHDYTGRAYLDGVNNICHVGHSHPHVVAALAQQAAVLNTNTRYLHDNILDYVERLGRSFADPLSVVYLVCSGSEANELALRIARTITGRRHTIVLDWAYHGNTNAALEVSPYKFNRKGGSGKPDHVEIATLPDPYRGPFKGHGSDSAAAYAQSVADKIEVIRKATGQGPAAFIAEAMSGCGGQVLFPDTYLKTAAQYVRDAGGLVIVDEVQTGFGRIGSHMWSHAAQGVVPDIVTIGKPIGNGHPMAAVVTTPDIAQAFANGMEFFSSFGGNPVSSAVGMAVLDVIENEGLQDKARITGDHLKSRLQDLAGRYPIIGDVRGQGLFLGVELVQDRDSLEPATRAAGRIINHMRNHGVLLSTDGPLDNVLKIKPPLAFGIAEADILIDGLQQALEAE